MMRLLRDYGLTYTRSFIQVLQRYDRRNPASVESIRILSMNLGMILLIFGPLAGIKYLEMSGSSASWTALSVATALFTLIRIWDIITYNTALVAR